MDDIPLYQADYGVSSLPEPEKGTIFIVTSVVEALSDREDLYAPLMPVYEDERVIKCLGLVQSKNTSNPKKE